MINYILYFNYVAILLQAMILVVTFIYSSVPSRTTTVFRLLCAISLLAGILNTITGYQCKTLIFTNTTFLWVLFVVSVLVTNLVAPAYLLFIISLTHEQIHYLRHQLMLTFIPLIYIVVSICTTPWTGFVFSIDNNGIIQSNTGIFILYLLNIFYLITANFYIIRHHDRLTIKQIHLVFVYSVLLIVSLIFQYLHPEYLITQLATSIAIFYVYFTLRNPSEFLDRNNGRLNRAAFREYFFTKKLEKRHLALGVINVTNFETVKQNYGTSNAYYLLRQNIDEIEKILHFNKEFYLFHNTFVFVDKNPEKVKRALRGIEAYIPSPMEIHNNNHEFNTPRISVHFECNVFAIDDISILNLNSLKSNLQNPTDKLIDLLEFAVNSENVLPCEINQIDEELVKEYEEIVQVQQAIQTAIRNDSFEVYLQPIFDFKTNSFTGAESLLRLKNEQGKFIPPTRFIHEAELNGTILILGDISLRKTCEYIKNGNLEKLGIKKVNVNLSIIQCMQDDIVKHLTDIIDDYQLPRNLFRFEITETLMAKDSFHLEQIMRELTDLGIEFALDDYGTGYSNTSRLLDFPFSEIKFDKSFVDSTLEDEKNAIPLKHLMNMVKDTGRIVLVEGVETREMSDLIKNYGGDLIQGFYYAKPLPCDDFVKIVQETNNK